MSLVLVGLCHGYHANHRMVRDQSFTDHQLLVEVVDTNRYGFEETKTIAVKLSKAHMDKGVQHVWDQYKGKQVSVPVFVGAWASKAGNAGFDLILAGEGKPLNLQLATKPVAA
ncbi:DNA-binding protein [Pseudomonas sp. TCU-HL1]|uniref:DNA-binding protein n=1 Tax=Pseudomonas sp. TCU-HL1 TaxID=1856685 RepID=UPI00083D4AFA|nr:DNA-binding protein [Pseudomonas sp. TCU-HL1]AOE85579.1 hypothetical protein THL1_3031 [Pseudomonas sp. TCU-HL1]AOE85592.1 hypothetical protein THL1_3044 [Pseudomonas sp. TCU-HL1]